MAAGLLRASIWLFGAWDVALAVTLVFGGLVAVLLTGVPGWKPFATGLVVLAVVAGGGFAVIVR
ncbi:MAG: UDP-galactose transporter [Nocardioides sp.]|nr:UDP-galactose transporter [Nocardioides sp.]